MSSCCKIDSIVSEEIRILAPPTSDDFPSVSACRFFNHGQPIRAAVYLLGGSVLPSLSCHICLSFCHSRRESAFRIRSAVAIPPRNQKQIPCGNERKATASTDVGFAPDVGNRNCHSDSISTVPCSPLAETNIKNSDARLIEQCDSQWTYWLSRRIEGFQM